MKTRVLLAVCAFVAAAAFSAAAIGIGDARDDVLRQLGKPNSIARRGDREIFLYSKGGRIEFVDGKVTDVKGPLPASLEPAAERPAVPEAAVPPPAAKTPSSSPATPAAPAPGRAASAPISAKPAASKPVSIQPAPAKAAPASKASAADDNPAIAANELAKHVEKMDTPWGTMPATHLDATASHSPLALLTGLLLRFVFTLIALKIAFKYWEMDAFWSGIFIIAGIDLAVHATLELLGPVTSGLTTMGPVENGIPGLVLIFTIHRFCFNKRMQNAVVTAAAVKLVVTLCYVFAGVAALNAIYG